MRYTLIKQATISQSESLIEWLKKNDWLSKSKAVKNFKPSKLEFNFDVLKFLTALLLLSQSFFFNHSIHQITFYNSLQT